MTSVWENDTNGKTCGKMTQNGNCVGKMSQSNSQNKQMRTSTTFVYKIIKINLSKSKSQPYGKVTQNDQCGKVTQSDSNHPVGNVTVGSLEFRVDCLSNCLGPKSSPTMYLASLHWLVFKCYPIFDNTALWSS